MIQRSNGIALERHGSGPPLVLVHGVGTNRGVWRRLVPLLSAEHEVITLDLPGFGDSPPLGPGFELEEVADALATALAPAHPELTLLGNSLGGAIALVLAARHPRLVERLVLSAPAGLAPRPGPLARLAGLGAGPAVAARRTIAMPFASSALARRVLLFGAVWDGSRLAPEDARAMLAASRSASRIGPAVATVARADLRDALGGLRMPVGFIWGERDVIVPASQIAALERRFGPLRVEIVEGAGHVAQLEAPEAYAEGLRRLLPALAR